MTVQTLEAATRIAQESPDTVAAIYEYTHALTGKKLWSVESWSNKGCTLESGMVLCPRLIYDGYEMEWMNES